MTTMSASVSQCGRRGSSKKPVVHKQDSTIGPDLRQVTVLSKVEWLRIQDNSNHVNKHKESLEEASRERERLHQRSKEMVKLWSNTIAGQRQKKLEAKKIREAIKEEERKQTDLAEAMYQQQKRQEAIEKAKAQQYNQTDRVKGFNRVLLLTEVLKEREAQLELKQRKLNASKDIDRDIVDQMKRKEERDLEQERQKADRRRMQNIVIEEDLKQQIREHELIREKEELENKKEAEELQRQKELYDWERSEQEKRKQEEKRGIMKAHMTDLSNRDIIRAVDAQKQEVEEERGRLFAAAKEEMMKLRKEKEAEMFREVQRHREAVSERLTAQQQEQVTNEEELIATAVAQQEAKVARKQEEQDRKKAAMMNSIALHRQTMLQKQEDREREEKHKALEMLNANKEADRIFLEKQQLKIQKMKEDGKALQNIHVHQMAVKKAKAQEVKKEQAEFESKNAALVAEEEKQFQIYAEGVIDTAIEAKRNTLLLRKAARERIGGGLGPSFGVHDTTGNISSTTKDIKELNETTDIQKSKERLGFYWQ